MAGANQLWSFLVLALAAPQLPATGAGVKRPHDNFKDRRVNVTTGDSREPTTDQLTLLWRDISLDRSWSGDQDQPQPHRGWDDAGHRPRPNK